MVCSLFTKCTGECHHSHVCSLFTANGSSECSSIHMSVGDSHQTLIIERCKGWSRWPAFILAHVNQEPLNAPFLNGLFPVDFQEVRRPLRTKSGKRPIKVRKRPIQEGKRPIKATVLVGISVGCLICFRVPPPWWKTAPLKRPIKRSMSEALHRGVTWWGCSVDKLRMSFLELQCSCPQSTAKPRTSFWKEAPNCSEVPCRPFCSREPCHLITWWCMAQDTLGWQ